MKLSALEIKQQSFAKSLRGYDVAEVQSFLNIISNEWEHLSNKSREQDREIARLNEKLQHYQKVEEALHETLQTAKASVEQRINSSKEEAQNRIVKAELEAEKILREAQHERQSIRQSIQRLLERRHEIIRGMESYFELATESLDSFKRDDVTNYSLPKEDAAEMEEKKPTAQDEKKKQAKSASVAPGAEDLDEFLDDLD